MFARGVRDSHVDTHSARYPSSRQCSSGALCLVSAQRSCGPTAGRGSHATVREVGGYRAVPHHAARCGVVPEEGIPRGHAAVQTHTGLASLSPRLTATEPRSL